VKKANLIPVRRQCGKPRVPAENPIHTVAAHEIG
jgi:hypothetical protein